VNSTDDRDHPPFAAHALRVPSHYRKKHLFIDGCSWIPQPCPFLKLLSLITLSEIHRRNIRAALYPPPVFHLLHQARCLRSWGSSVVTYDEEMSGMEREGTLAGLFGAVSVGANMGDFSSESGMKWLSLHQPIHSDPPQHWSRSSRYWILTVEHCRSAWDPRKSTSCGSSPIRRSSLWTS